MGVSTQLVDVSPATARGCLAQARAHRAERQFRQALDRCEEAISRDPRSAEAWVEKGELLLEMGEARKAQASHDRAIEIDPLCLGAWLGLAAALTQSGALSDALSYCEKAIRVAPSDPRAWTGKGRTLARLGRYEDALRCFDKALEPGPGHVDAWWGKASCLEDQKRIEEALTCLERVVALDPRHVRAWGHRGRLLANLGRHEEAAACFRQALAVETSAAALHGLGASLETLGGTEEALACQVKATELDPKLTEAWFRRGRMEHRLGRRVDAAGSLRRYLELMGNATSEEATWARESLNLLERAEVPAAPFPRKLVRFNRPIAEDATATPEAAEEPTGVYAAAAKAAVAKAETAGFRAVGWTCADLARAVERRADSDDDVRAIVAACCSIVTERRDAGWASDLGIPRQVLNQAIDRVLCKRSVFTR